MSRRAIHACPVAGCSGLRTYRQACCDACWRRMPADLRAGIMDARRAGARHREAELAIKAVNHLARTAPQAVAEIEQEKKSK